MRMLVGLTQRITVDARRNEVRDALDHRWGLVAKALAWHPIPLFSPVSDPKVYLDTLNLDMLILTGGETPTSPAGPGASLRAYDVRDHFERRAIYWAIQRAVPIVGICRGLQVLALHFGGSLRVIEGHVAKNHDVQWDGVSRVHNVTCFHEWGIATLPDRLTPTAIACDGSVEAFRHRHLPIQAVMWHPERREHLSPADLNWLREVGRLR
ncbi:gamma-glutamyl-gamma-aminobutyrate hydrolase family protein [Modestobacter sp. URMC 112]